MSRYTRKTFIEVSSVLESFSDLIDQFTFEDLVFEFGEMLVARVGGLEEMIIDKNSKENI